MSETVGNGEMAAWSPPYLRSRGGTDTVSFDRPGSKETARHRSNRRREAHLSASGVSADFVEAARRELSAQRAFRRIQLVQLDLTRAEAVADAVRNEVHEKLSAGARAMLSDIDSALRRIELGSYGRCQDCGEPMSLGRLSALPMAALCGSCQRFRELSGPEISRPRASAGGG